MCKIPERKPGQVPVEILPNSWANISITFKTSLGAKTRFQTINLRTQKRYLCEPMLVIAVKCCALFLFVNPAYFVFYTATQLTRIIVVPLANRSVDAFIKEIWHAVKIPFYFIAMEFSALYGVLDPLQGREWFGEWEKDLHDGKTRRVAIGYQKDQKNCSELMEEAFLKEDPKVAFFIAFCMQPQGSLNDPHIMKWEFCPQSSLAV